MFSWIGSPLCRDIQFALASIIFGFVIIGVLIFDQSNFFTLLSVLATALVTLTIFLINAAIVRINVATIFSSEVRNICNVMYLFGLSEMDKIIAENWTTVKEHLTSRQENYIETYTGNIDKITTLPKEIVFQLTAFFTYLKGSRDAVLVVNHWDNATKDDRKRKDMVRIGNQLYNCLVRGRLAVKLLQEDWIQDRNAKKMDMDLRRIEIMITSLRNYLAEDIIDLTNETGDLTSDQTFSKLG
jgi:hypothetical protein